MKRSGFKPKTYARPPRQYLIPIAPEVSSRFKAVPVAQEVNAALKTEAKRNPALLAMARGRQCLFRLPGCDGGGETTVAAHSNHAEHGKAGARKADDQFSAWGCFACHSKYDQGNAPASERRAWFDAAHARQVEIWKRMAENPLVAGKRDRELARWALEQLGLTA